MRSLFRPKARTILPPDAAMLLKKTIYDKIVDYGIETASNHWLKTFVLSICGGLFACFGNLATQFVRSYDPSSVGYIYLGSSLFAVGLMMIVFIGGYLFTTSSMLFIAYIERRIPIKAIYIHLPLVLIGNLVGAFMFSVLTRFSGFYENMGDRPFQMLFYGAKTMKDKLFLFTWYEIFFQAIFCNFLVAGCILATYSVDSAVAKLFLIQTFITIFGVLAYQHIVANFYTFSIATLYSGAAFPQAKLDAQLQKYIDHGDANQIERFIHDVEFAQKYLRDLDWGKMIGVNGIPTAIGNFLTGAIILPIAYKITKQVSVRQELEKARTHEKKLHNQIVEDIKVSDEAHSKTKAIRITDKISKTEPIDD